MSDPTGKQDDSIQPGPLEMAAEAPHGKDNFGASEGQESPSPISKSPQPISVDSNPDVGDASLTDSDLELEGYDLGALRLRRRTKFGGLALCVGVFLPYEVIDGQPQFIWDLVGELPAAGIMGMLVPLLMGISLVAMNAYVQRTSLLAFTGLITFLTGYICLILGTQATAWAELPMPESLIRAPTLSVLILASVAAGCCLTFEDQTAGWGISTGHRRSTRRRI